MKSKEKMISLSLIISCGLLLLIPSISGIQKETTISDIASKDTYVDIDNPNSNYGGVSYLMSGYSVSYEAKEAYFYFDFTNKPSSFTEAEISLDFWSVSQTMNFTVCLIEEEWEELIMTWYTGKPSKGQVIEYLIVASDDIYTINVTSLITGRTNLSICVYIEFENYVNDYAYIYSREGYYSDEDAPQLIWTYMETAEIAVTSPGSTSNWLEFNTYAIQWTSIGTIEDVEIELYKSSTFVEEITFLPTDNDGEYDFYVSSLEDYYGSDYRIKIIDHDDPNVYDYSDYFSINIRTGTITVTSPDQNSYGTPGSIHMITWTSTGNIIEVDIDIYKGSTRRYYVSRISDFGYYMWTIPEDIELGTDWRIKISNSDNSAENDWSEYFSISTTHGDPIPGYDLIIIISSVFLLSILYVKKKIKRCL